MSIVITITFDGTKRELLNEIIKEALKRADSYDSELIGGKSAYMARKIRKEKAAILRGFVGWMQRIEIVGEP